MRFIARFMGFIFATGAILFAIGAAVAVGGIWYFQKDLPDDAALKNMNRR